MKPSFLLLSILLISALLFVGCGNTGDVPVDEVSTVDTTSTFDSMSTPDVTSTPDTTTSASETTASAFRRPVAQKLIKHTELGIAPYIIVNGDRNIAEAETGNTGSKIYAYSDGTTTITFEDCFGHKASADVTVKGDQLEVTLHPTTDEFIEVTLDYGANGRDSASDQDAIQRAIDEAKPGDTVYIYPGIYNVELLVMREGITLEMFTTMTDAHEGFTSKLASDTRQGKITVLSGVRIMNNGNKQPGREGSSNFTIRGGVLDMKETTRGAIIFGKADNVLLENVILKDMKNNHSIQLTGCTNTTVRNCMFAGYTWGDTFTREVLQVEVSTPGATGAVPNSPLQFSEGEYYYCENIEISHCYFGKSDECGAPLMAIGHHSQAGDATVTGFRIIDNVFDEVLYAGIRYCNLVDTEISGNTFISTSKYKNVEHADATNPAFIVIYSSTATTTYTSVVNGQKITQATSSEQAGTHNMRIENNTFSLGEGSDKKIIYVTGNGSVPGVVFQSGLIRQQFYNTQAYNYAGYSYRSNCIEGLVFANNTITVEGKLTYSNYLMYFQQVLGLTYENNTVNLPAGVSFTGNSENVLGLNTRGCVMGKHTDKYTIATGTQGTVMLGGTVMSATGKYTVTIKLDGDGYLAISDDGRGNATMTPTPAEGYSFDGFYDASGAKTGTSLSVTGNMTLTARFVKK
ncbi:MAG: hypothetical protein IJY27_08030 [Clostridia bacterium]|nr:hypothetical protein [Clostridia bacterium]